MLVVNWYPSVKGLLSLPINGDEYVTTGVIVPANTDVEQDARTATIPKAKRFTNPSSFRNIPRIPPGEAAS